MAGFLAVKRIANRTLQDDIPYHVGKGLRVCHVSLQHGRIPDEPIRVDAERQHKKFTVVAPLLAAAESGFLLLFKPMFASLVLPAMLLSRFMSFYVLLVVCGIACAYVHFRKPHNTPANKKFKG